MEYELFAELKEAWGRSTMLNNRFKKLLDAIAWDNQFQADGEFYFCFGGLTITAESLNPFTESWKPSALFSDGSLIEF